MKKVFSLLMSMLCIVLILSGCQSNNKMAEPSSTEDQISPTETIPSTEPQISQLQHTLQFAKQNMGLHDDGEAYYVQDPENDDYLSASLLVTNEMLSALGTAPKTLTAAEAKEAFQNGKGYIAGDDYRIIASEDLNSYSVYYIPSGHMYYCTDSCCGEYVMVDDMEVVDSVNSEKDIFSDEEYCAEAYLDGTWDGKATKYVSNGKYGSHRDYVYYVGSELEIEFLYRIALTPNYMRGGRPFCRVRMSSAYGNYVNLTASNVAGESGMFLDLNVAVCLYEEGVVVFRDDGASYRDPNRYDVIQYGEVIAFDSSPADRAYILGQYGNEIWYIRYVDDLDFPYYLYDKDGNIRLDENGNREYPIKLDGYLHKIIVSDDGNVAFDKVSISGWHTDASFIPLKPGEHFGFIDANGSQKTYTISGDANTLDYLDNRKIVEI